MRARRAERARPARQIEENLGLAVPFTVLFEYPTLRALAGHLLLLLHSPGAAPIGAQAEQGLALGDLAAAAAGEAPARLLLAADAKAAGVPCSPAQLFFVAAHLVRARGCQPRNDASEWTGISFRCPRGLMLGQLRSLVTSLSPQQLHRLERDGHRPGGAAGEAVIRRKDEGPLLGKAGQ
jgi:hypothetical protein